MMSQPHIPDPSLVRGLTQRRLGRRDALRLSGLSALGLALSACGVKGQGAPAATSMITRRERQPNESPLLSAATTSTSSAIPMSTSGSRMSSSPSRPTNCPAANSDSATAAVAALTPSS